MTRIDLDVVADDIWSLIGGHHGGYLHRLRALLPEPGTPTTSESSTSHKVIGSPAPWNDEAAGILFEIHAGARRHERHLRHALGFNPIRRGNTDHQTIAVLTALPELLRAIDARHLDSARPDLERAQRDITRWPRICRRILDDDPGADERPMTRAPGDLKCPECKRRLWLKFGWQHDPAPSLWCPRCPATRDDDEPRGVDLSWPATEWIARLQDDTA